jgi:tetratricopeptide (TPR) repeat protein
LEAPKEGGVVKDSAIQDKTENMMLCVEYSHGNLKPDDQKLLMILAPFTTVVYQPLIEKYIEHLKQQPALADLPFQRWPEALQQAQDCGLIAADQVQGYLRLQPVLPYFLRTRLNQTREMKEAVETAYRDFYDGFAGDITDLMGSKDAQEKQVGQMLACQEYENLYTALELSLKAKGSIFNPNYALSMYIDSTQDQERGLKLDQMVLARREDYPAEALKGPIGVEMVGIVDSIAGHQLSLKQYSEAEASYRRALGLTEDLIILDKKNRGIGQAGIYHQLGRVAEEQRLWKQAEEYYQKALKTWINFNDIYRQASEYHQLGMIAEGQGQWEQAKDYYQKALKIYIDFNDIHSQAKTIQNLGAIALEHNQWDIAQENLLKALEIFIEFEDQQNGVIALDNLASLWQVTMDQRVLTEVARILSISKEDAKELLEEVAKQ